MLLPRLRVFSFAVCLVSLAMGHASPVRADGANGYGAKGRTIIQGGLQGAHTTYSGYQPSASPSSTSLGGVLTVVHFVVDNFALGGTLAGGTSKPVPGIDLDPSTTWFAADLDTVFYVPSSHRTGMRFWLFGGLRGNHVAGVVGTNVDAPPPVGHSHLSLALGLPPRSRSRP